MAGTHRGKPDYPAPIALLAVIIVPCALIALAIYVGIRHSSALFIVGSVLDAVIVIEAAHRVVLNLGGKRPETAEEVVSRLSLVAQLIGAVVVVLEFIGQSRGWMGGIFGDVVLGVVVLYLIGMPVYRFGGKSRLIAALRARAAGDDTGP